MMQNLLDTKIVTTHLFIIKVKILQKNYNNNKNDFVRPLKCVVTE